jgi:hypothetical protein
MSDGALKPEKDFSKEADQLIPEAEELAKVRKGTGRGNRMPVHLLTKHTL